MMVTSRGGASLEWGRLKEGVETYSFLDLIRRKIRVGSRECTVLLSSMASQLRIRYNPVQLICEEGFRESRRWRRKGRKQTEVCLFG